MAGESTQDLVMLRTWVNRDDITQELLDAYINPMAIQIAKGLAYGDCRVPTDPKALVTCARLILASLFVQSQADAEFYKCLLLMMVGRVEICAINQGDRK